MKITKKSSFVVAVVVVAVVVVVVVVVCCCSRSFAVDFSRRKERKKTSPELDNWTKHSKATSRTPTDQCHMAYNHHEYIKKQEILS